MNDKDQLWKLKRYYEKVLIDYYSTDEIDPDMANRIVGGLTRFMNITEQQQQEIEKLTRIAAEADEGCEYWKDKYKQMKSKSERYEKALENIVISIFPLDIDDAVAIANQALLEVKKNERRV